MDRHVALGLYRALFALGALVLVARKSRWFIAAFLAILAVFCLADQTRWQPWVFQYGFLLAADGAALDGRAPMAKSGCSTRPADRRLYLHLFSGLQKMNLNFVDERFSVDRAAYRRCPAIRGRPARFTRFGMAAPLLQVAFGAGLLTARFRRVSLIAAVAMHLFILAMFGPAELDWNNVVWPWTAAMAVFDIVLFSGATEFSWREIVWSGREPLLMAAALLLFAVLPALSFFNLWDSYLFLGALFGQPDGSANLSVRCRKGLAARGDQPRTWCVTSPDTNVLNLQRWAIEDSQRDALSGNPALQGDRKTYAARCAIPRNWS